MRNGENVLSGTAVREMELVFETEIAGQLSVVVQWDLKHCVTHLHHHVVAEPTASWH